MSRHWNFNVLDKSNALTIRFVSRVLWPWVFCPKSSQSDIVGKLGALHVPRDGESSIRYDTVLLPSTGYVKTLLEFLIQHSSHKSNKKVSSVVHWLVVLCKLFLHIKKYIISHQAVWRSNVSFFFLIKWFNDFRF